MHLKGAVFMAESIKFVFLCCPVRLPLLFFLISHCIVTLLKYRTSFCITGFVSQEDIITFTWESPG